MTALDVATETPALSASNVTVRYGGLTALADVSVSIGFGEIVGLVGPNGAGKSTLFGVLSGLIRPQSGRVFMSGSDVSAASPQKRAALGLARTFQHPEIFDGMTVREHAVLAYRIRHEPRRIWRDSFTPASLRRAPGPEVEYIDQLLHALQLSDIQDRPALGLPLGRCRVLEIARAIARGPSVLLLDEASSGLDSAETEHLVGVLRNLVSMRAISLLVVEHNVDLVMSLVDRVCVLDFGRLIAAGTPDDVLTDPRVRAAYLGEAGPKSVKDESIKVVR